VGSANDVDRRNDRVERSIRNPTEFADGKVILALVEPETDVDFEDVIQGRI
jgi:hypothetical protein